MALLKDERIYTIVDPLHHDDFETSRGKLKAGRGGYIRTRNAELAQEIEQREPWALVTEHEPFKGEGLRGQSMMVVPELLWKKDNHATKKGEEQKDCKSEH